MPVTADVKDTSREYQGCTKQCVEAEADWWNTLQLFCPTCRRHAWPNKAQIGLITKIKVGNMLCHLAFLSDDVTCWRVSKRFCVCQCLEGLRPLDAKIN